LIDEAQKALEEAEALKKVVHMFYFIIDLYMKLLKYFYFIFVSIDIVLMFAFLFYFCEHRNSFDVCAGS